MPTLLSVNVGLPRDVEWNGRTRPHRHLEEPGRRPGHGPAAQSRRRRAGRPWRARRRAAGRDGLPGRLVRALAPSSSSRSDLTHGIFGENFTVDGLARRRGLHRRPLPHRRGRVRGDPAADHLLPRRVCGWANRRWPRCSSRTTDPASTSGCSGRDTCEAGDDIVKIGRRAGAVDASPPPMRCSTCPTGDVDTMRRAAATSPPSAPAGKARSATWSTRPIIRSALAGAAASRRGTGSGRMRVARLVRETELVTSVYLRPVDGERAAAAAAGPVPDAYG